MTRPFPAMFSGYLILFSLLAFFPCHVHSQTTKYTISGYIEDEESGEKLIGANVLIRSLKTGTSTNTYGFYSITLPADTYTLVFSYVGFAAKYISVNLNKNIQMNLELSPSVMLKEVTIEADQSEKIEEMTKMSTIKIQVDKIKSIPALFGEVDVIKAIQLLPGVQSGMEGSSGLYVRGGGPDQNLILLDGVPVYNASHLFGFFSVFNADAIKNIELIKGGFPARYGGRLSSVLEINMKEGNMKKIHGEGSVGLIASKFTIEGPVVKEKSSFIISARRTYIDILAQPIIAAINASYDDDYRFSTGYYFYDLNAKFNHKFSDKDRLYFSVYNGDDRFYFRLKPYTYTYDNITYTEKENSNLSWGNITSALRWNHMFSNKLFGNLTLTYSKYKFDVEDDQVNTQNEAGHITTERFYIQYLSGIHDWTGKIDFDFIPHPNHYIKYGGSAIYHTFRPGVTAFKLNFGGTKIDSTLGAKDVYATETALYIEDDYKINDHLKANFGLHYSGFFVREHYYDAFQPRMTARYLFGKNWSAKVSYAQMQQNIHLLTNTNIGLPTDLWVPSTDKIKPQYAHQLAAGFAHTLKNYYQISIEGYYKNMNNLIEYKEGATFINTEASWEDKIVTGKGWAYGAEFFIEKKSGKTTGWIGYTLAWADRKFKDLNFGETFPYKYDRRHDISVVVNHEFSKTLSLAATWVYGTGNSLTLPIVRYLSYDELNNWYSNEIEYFEKKNDFRMAAYHRLDIGLTKTKETKWGESSWNYGLYNAYSRRNPFFYYFGSDNRGNPKLYRVSLFPIIPSISYNFKF